MESKNAGLPSLLEVFHTIAQHPVNSGNIILKYGQEEWTYADLDLISNGIALELRKIYNLQPTVVSLCENHPLVFAYMLATWKLGGIFAPIDHHAPPEMTSKMLENIEPTCVLAPSDKDLKHLVQGLIAQVMPLPTGELNLASLKQKFADSASEQSFPPPDLQDIALYIHTSSAAGPWNLKCVPVSHGMLSYGSHCRTESLRKRWSGTFEKARVLGWAPWSHIMAVMSDVGAGALLTSGCYIFGITKNVGRNGQVDVVERLLDAVVEERPDIFVTIPWVVDGFRKKHSELLGQGRTQEASTILDSLRSVKAFITGGAKLSTEAAIWAQENGIGLSNDLGMTETGPLFSTQLNLAGTPENLWLSPAVMLTGASLILMDEDGLEAKEEGELVVSSYYISERYLKYDSSAFSKDEHGRNVFKTGDLYKRLQGGELEWQGRKDDYIQMVSTETFDPRPIEAALDRSPGIARSAIIGNNFLRKASEYLIAIVEPHLVDSASTYSELQITRAIAAINKVLSPPLRISWSHILVLGKGEAIPSTRKRAVFRKKLESMFAERIARLTTKRPELDSPNSNTAASKVMSLAPTIPDSTSATPKSTISGDSNVLVNIVEILADVLLLDPKIFEENKHCTFAELGMDSNMAIRIVKTLNRTFNLDLPPSACHTYIDLEMLHRAVIQAMNVKNLNSHFSISTSPQIDANPPSPSVDEIVIVGQAIRLPGDLNTPELFWNALVEKRADIMTRVPVDRWDHASFYRPPDSSPLEPGEIYFEKAGFMDVSHFDNSFFGISPPEAKHITPAVRLMLEVAFEAFENANIPVSSVKGSNMGVWTAPCSSLGYSELLYHESGFGAYSRFHGLGAAPSAACGRLSYLLDVHGPSMTIDTACSSSMVALHEAVQYLRSGEGESAIIAAGNTMHWPGSFSFLSTQKMASPLGRCATFTDEADGYVPSEGAAAIILKTMSAALRDNDNILAVVRSTNVKHGGRSQGLVAPNVNVQIALQYSLLQKARLQPSQIDFLEAHGTGTSLGDMIEINSINEVFQNSHPESPLLIGAAKSCVGHTEFAAGLVGVIKAIGTLHHRIVPGIVRLHQDNLNRSIDLQKVPLCIPTETVGLPSRLTSDTHHGLVLSNGFAGTIAGTILASAPPVEQPHSRHSSAQKGSYLFVLSAKSRRALEMYLESYLAHCRLARPEDLPFICYTSCLGREHYRHRLSIVVATLQDLIQQLEDLLNDFTHKTHRSASNTLFAFPGQGSQYQGMAASLALAFPTFEDIIMSTSSLASERTGLPITSYLLEHNTPRGVPSIDDAVVAQVSIFVYQHALSSFIQILGILPTATLGHSLGEVSAAVTSGALSFDVGLDLVIARARTLRSDVSRPSGMAIVASSTMTIHDLIRQLGLVGKLVIAVYNGPYSHVVSGEIEALDSFTSRAVNSGMRVSKLKVAQGFHSPAIHPSLPKLQQWLLSGEYLSTRLTLPLYSTAYGTEIIAGQSLRSTHWVQHARESVRFSDAIHAVNSSNEVDTILDLGPQPFIWTILQDYPEAKICIPTTTKPTGDQAIAFLRGITRLFEQGTDINFSKLFPAGLKKVPLPTYPYQRQRFYPSVIPSRNSLPPNTSSINPSPIQGPRATPVVFSADAAMRELLSDHLIESRRVVPGAGLVDLFIQSSPCRSLKSLFFHAPLVVGVSDPKAEGTIETNGAFSLFAGGSSSNLKVASGLMHRAAPAQVPRISISATQPRVVLDKEGVYECFRNVAFGDSFRNIQELRIYDTHAEGSIHVLPSPHLNLDRIRKLDACLHMFGAINEKTKQMTVIRRFAGGFLPVAIEDVTFHSDEFPDAFLCRYQLPFSGIRDYSIMHTSFEVTSLDGDLLVSCGKYSVAWVPSGLALQDDKQSKAHGLSEALLKEAWMQQVWLVEPASHNKIPRSSAIDHSYFISSEGVDSKLYRAISPLSQQTTVIPLPVELPVGVSFLKDLAAHFGSGEAKIILDLTPLNHTPTDASFSSVHQHALALLQVLNRCKTTITQFVVISQNSIPVTSDDPNGFIGLLSNGPGVAAVVQGMVRVFRREAGLDDVVWSLDLPILSSLTDDQLQKIIQSEMLSRIQGPGPLQNRSVAYRESRISGLVRLVPRLRSVVQTPLSSRLGGVCVVVGMGDIGVALGPSLLEIGCSNVIFIGRRSEDERSVVDTLKTLQQKTTGRCAYVQADVCDSNGLSTAIDGIQSSTGPIEHIIHTAVIIHDASIQNVTPESFEAVLRPKVMGAWNLDKVTREKCKSLKSFMLLSSISVSLGNEGQIAYVAGNFYIETLAAHRVASGLPATCLQIGPWLSSNAAQRAYKEGGLVRGLTDDEGVTLILQAMKSSMDKDCRTAPVQVIAKFDTARLAGFGPYKRDPLFSELSGAGQAANEHLEVGSPIKSNPSDDNPLNGKPHLKQDSDISEKVMKIIEEVIELAPGEILEASNSLLSAGFDSISFAQVRGRILQELGVEIPMRFLGESFMLKDVVGFVRERL